MTEEYIKHLSEPWFTDVQWGLKTSEARLKRGDFEYIKVGDTIRFVNNAIGPRSVRVQVTSISNYGSFEDYLKNELDKCLPRVETINQGVQIYRQYYTVEDERLHGVCAIKLKLTLIAGKSV